jgi:hypothetical protein
MDLFNQIENIIQPVALEQFNSAETPKLNIPLPEFDESKRKQIIEAITNFFAIKEGAMKLADGVQKFNLADIYNYVDRSMKEKVSDGTVTRYMRAMRTKGLINYECPARDGVYTVLKKVVNPNTKTA